MIEQRHEIPLTTAITKSVPGRGALVASLYHECLNVLNNVPSKTGTVTKFRTTQPIEDLDGKKLGEQVTAIVTDNDSGLFIQLAMTTAPNGAKRDGPFLVFGKKYLEEAKIPQLSNTGVKLWQ